MARSPSSTLPANPASQKREKQRVAQDEALLREVDDAVRQDDLASFGKRYGKALLALLVLALIALGAFLWWQNQRQQTREQNAEAFIAALDQLDAGNLSQANEQLSALETKEVGTASLARLLSAGIALENGNPQRAAQIYAAVADDTGVEAELRDLARIRQVAIEFDTLQPAQIIQRLQGMAQPGNAFFGSAGEMIAMAHLRQGDRQAAGRMFAEVANVEGAPESLKARARQMAGLLGVDTITNVEQALDTVAPVAPAPAQAQ